VDYAKGIKNETEQQNFRNANLRDGRATVSLIIPHVKAVLGIDDLRSGSMDGLA